jgi:hypothetical protein
VVPRCESLRECLLSLARRNSLCKSLNRNLQRFLTQNEKMRGQNGRRALDILVNKINLTKMCCHGVGMSIFHTNATPSKLIPVMIPVAVLQQLHDRTLHNRQWPCHGNMVSLLNAPVGQVEHIFRQVLPPIISSLPRQSDAFARSSISSNITGLLPRYASVFPQPIYHTDKVNSPN